MVDFNTIPLSVVGPTEKLKSIQLDSQLTQNFYIYLSESGPVLNNFPGSLLFSSATSIAAERGSHVFNGELYVLTGTTLERVGSDGVRATIGTISGSGRCIFDDDGSNLLIANSGTLHNYNGTTLSTITNAVLESPNSVTVINRQAIVDGNTNRWMVADYGTPTSFIADNTGVKESKSDDLLRPYAFDERLYLFGDTVSTEVWWNSGVGNPPFDEITGSLINVGLGALHSVSNTVNNCYFLGADINIYKMKGTQVSNISNPGIAKEINGMSTASDAIGMCFNIEGLSFYKIDFPTGNKSFLYCENSDIWTSLSYGVNGDRHIAGSYQRCYNKHLIVDRRNGDVHEWRLDTYTDNGDAIQRKRILPKISGEMLKKPGMRILIDRFELILQKGVGIAGNGQGSDPSIMIEVSSDGGESYENLQYIRIGRAGESTIKVESYFSRSAYEFVFRITITDPVFTNIRAASIDLKADGY